MLCKISVYIMYDIVYFVLVSWGHQMVCIHNNKINFYTIILHSCTSKQHNIFRGREKCALFLIFSDDSILERGG
jgi:hypothetical protein